MAITFDVPARKITVPQSDLTLVTGTLYELDTNWFREQMNDFGDSEEGMMAPDTHQHFTEVTISGDTQARTIIMINGWRVEFSPDSQWSVRLVGSNNNIWDIEGNVLVQNQVQVIPTNSFGLVKGAGAQAVWDEVIEGGYTARQLQRIMAAALAGTLSGAESATITIKGVDGTTTRIQAVGVDDAGNRPTVNLDGD